MVGEGPIIRKETFFNVLDGGAFCLAMYTLNFLHPGFLLPLRPLKVDLGSKDSSVAKIGKALKICRGLALLGGGVCL